MVRVLKRVSPFQGCLALVLCVCLSGVLCASVHVDPRTKREANADPADKDPAKAESADPAAKKPADPAAKDPADPAAKDPADPAAKDPADPAAKDPADPAAKDPADPAAKVPADPAAKVPADPAAKVPADPAVPADASSSKSISEPNEDQQKDPAEKSSKSSKSSKLFKHALEDAQKLDENLPEIEPSLAQSKNDSNLLAEESQVAASIVPLDNALINSNPKDAQQEKDADAPLVAASPAVEKEIANSPTPAEVSDQDGQGAPNTDAASANPEDPEALPVYPLRGEAEVAPVDKTPPNLSAYKYLLKSNVCPAQPEADDPILAVILIMSAAKNVDLRNNIRITFPQKDIAGLGLRRVFVLASDEDTSASKLALKQENEEFSDIVQFNTKETFSDLPKTVLLAMKFAALNCKQAKFFIKSEDNVLIDYYRVAKEFQELKEGDSDKIIGHVWRAMAPIRPNTNPGVDPKYFTTVEEFPEDTFPTYVSGIFFAVSYKTAKKLLKVSKTENYFKTEDVYVTGMLAKAAGIEHLDISRKFTFEPNSLMCCKKPDASTVYQCMFMIGYGHGTAIQIEAAMLKIRKHSEYCHTNQNCTILAEGDYPAINSICS